MLKVGLYFFLALGVLSWQFCAAQSGSIIVSGDQVLDPNQDGFISINSTGFSSDGYDVDEFEIPMFGIPIFGDGEALNDVQSGPGCGVTDLALDSAGYAIYAAFDANENLIFRFRLSDDHPSVQSYSILIDTDQLVGSADPNATSDNPGFEIAITLIQKFGVYLYDIDGIESCPSALVSYNIATNQQKSSSAQQSCGSEDIYIDFYLPFADLTTNFGITPSSNLRFVGVTNISATCALDGSISDIGGVDDTDYNGCFSCAVLDITENQCPTSISNLCSTCAGFPIGFTATPEINVPILVNDLNISGTASPDSEIYIELYSGTGTLLDRDTTVTNSDSTWLSNNFINPLAFGDSVVVNAYVPGKCVSGLNNAGLSFAIVTPDLPPEIQGNQQSISYTATEPPILIADDLIILDDNSSIIAATISLSQNFELGADILDATPTANISVSYSPTDGILSFTGNAPLAEYELALRSVTFYNSSSTPSLNIRDVTIIVNDGSSESLPFIKSILITPLNEAPVIIGSTDSLQYTEGQGPVPLDNLIEVSDANDTELVTATVTFINGFVALEDTLVLIDQNGITSAFSNQSLILVGTASLADYQTALRSITYENKSIAPDTTLRQIEIIINDARENSIPFTRYIVITPVIEPPVIEVFVGGGSSKSLDYSEGDGQVLLLPNLDLQDPDDVNLESAEIVFDTNFLASEDSLSAVPQSTIQLNYDENLGSLTLSGTATLSDYLATLRTLSYENSSENPSNLSRSLSIDVFDGEASSNKITITINVIPVNDAPLITGVTERIKYPESSGPMIIDPTISLEDVDNIELTSAEVSISNNYQSSEDILSFDETINGIQGSFDSNTGILSLNGLALVSEYEAVIKTVAYENIQDTANQNLRTVQIIINDGNLNSIPYLKEIEILVVEPPIIEVFVGGGSSKSIDYSEGDGQVLLLPNLALQDPDDINLESAEIVFDTNYLASEDRLSAVPQSTIQLNYDENLGILTLSGTASLSDYLATLRTLSYENSSENPSNLSRSLSMQVSDADGSSNKITITINVIPVNDAPLITGVTERIIYPESSGPMIIDPTLSLEDVDNAELTSAEVSISNNYQSSEDILSFDETISGIQGSFDSNTGILSLNGNALVSEYEAVLKSLAYENIKEIANRNLRTVQVIVNDGNLNSNVYLREIEILEVEDPIIVYQVVTPDGDGYNDKWIIDGILQFPNNKIQLFNRWNSLVFETSGYDNDKNSWSGQGNTGFNKGDLPEGTYFFTINLGDGATLKEGFIVLKRK